MNTPKPSLCKSCGAQVYWAVNLDSGKWSPVNAEPHPGGGLVLTLSKGQLVIETYRPTVHASSRRRYVSHFATCVNADQHRKAK